LTDLDDVAVMVDDEQDRHWSTMGLDLEAWIRGEVAERRDPIRVKVDRAERLAPS
jgi:hypothetical protein